MKEIKVKELINYLNEHVIGQDEAKKTIATAIKRKFKVNKIKDDEWRNEITPTNILMIGDTGVGKTEIMRRIAKYLDVPFVKVDITEFSQTGYVGRNVEEIITVDLFNATKDWIKKYHSESIIDDEFIENLAKQIIQYDNVKNNGLQMINPFLVTPQTLDDALKDIDEIKEKIKNNDPQILNKYVEIAINVPVKISIGKIYQPMILTGTVKQIIEKYKNIVIDKLLTKKAKELLKQGMENAIVFIDEIDKIAGKDNRNVSTVGVQRGLLTLLEDKIVNIDDVVINTKNILFVAAGAFKVAEVDDLLPELLGRLTVKVKLRPLTKDELYRILIEPKYSVIKKLQKLFETDNIKLEFTDEAIRYIADLAYELNKKQNISARRLNQLVEQLTMDLELDIEEGNINLDSNNRLLITKKYLEEKYNKYGESIKDTDTERKIGF